MKTILVVDDEYAIVEVLGEVLRDEGFRVVSAANGQDGLARLEKEKPDLIIADYMMPIGDGRELVQKIRAIPQHRSTPIVMMSSASEQSALSDGRGGRLEVSSFLSKPFSIEDFLAMVTLLIGEANEGQVPEDNGHLH